MTDIQFASVKDAVRWSEEISTIPDMGGGLDGLIGKTSGGRVTRQDMIEIALSISLITASCKPFGGQMMKAVYAGRDRERDNWLGMMLASRLATTDHGQEKDYEQLMALGIAMVKATRAKELYGDRFPLKRMAHDVGVSRESFTRSLCWPALRAEAADHIRIIMDQAINKIAIELNDRGWMA
jgi:hypothetical protein